MSSLCWNTSDMLISRNRWVAVTGLQMCTYSIWAFSQNITSPKGNAHVIAATRGQRKSPSAVLRIQREPPNFVHVTLTWLSRQLIVRVTRAGIPLHIPVLHQRMGCFFFNFIFRREVMSKICWKYKLWNDLSWMSDHHGNRSLPLNC